MTTDTIHNEPPPVQEGQIGEREYGIMFHLFVPGLMFYMTGEDIYSTLLQTVIGGALQSKNLLCADKAAIVIGHIVQVIGVFFVTDKWAALGVVRDELDRLKVLQFSQLGYFDADAASWVGWYPPDLADTMQKNWETLMRWRTK